MKEVEVAARGGFGGRIIMDEITRQRTSIVD
eukprot:CAMPEP_0201616626 /NCGR_PEP_ID=MMETSP0492-20130828/34346_1 /ASSEMBLY_ACC=CAM_ASM_000837 /TAXON_ID=420259 /ORGANISM="Thalassiosira gravida, Strain GMp14c1" /LENGTH=30 /DNA_ID= /DNA_START= /DNA_END= /DNA_ORIENTATION=